MPTTDTAYQSYHTGAQLDEMADKILDGTIEQAAEDAKAAADRAEAATVNTPYISTNGNWMIWNTSTEKYVDSGKSSKGSKGDTGPTGATGPQGPPGVVVDVGVGQFTLHINSEGHLIATINT